MPSQLFVPTGTMETFVVPPHQPGTLEVWIEGGRGANGARLTATIRSIGGVGGRFHGTLNLPAGTTLYVIAGYGATDALPDFHQQAGFGPAFGGQGGNGGSAGVRDRGPAGRRRVAPPRKNSAPGGAGARKWIGPWSWRYSRTHTCWRQMKAMQPDMPSLLPPSSSSTFDL